MRCTTTLVLTHLFACLAQAADPAPDRAGPVRSGPRPAALDAFIESHCAQCHHTRFWRGRGLVQSGELQPGQTVLFNLAWVTLYGPGRLTDIWLDEESRTLATAHQREVHRDHVRERGLAGFVSAVEDVP